MRKEVGIKAHIVGRNVQAVLLDILSVPYLDVSCSDWFLIIMHF